MIHNESHDGRGASRSWKGNATHIYQINGRSVSFRDLGEEILGDSNYRGLGHTMTGAT